ncbi:MAG: SDR family oxidoreductase [bacterium]|nr:SDR family oxidoreductase [bacterium]
MRNVFEKFFSLAGKRAVVTGAGRGIGRAVAEAFAAAGAEVCVHYYSSKEKARDVVNTIQADGGKAWSAGADLTDSASTKVFFKEVETHWGALDILVNNAGDLVQRCKIEDFPDELIETVLRTNIHTTLYASREAIPLLRKGHSASIVNVGSIAARNGGFNGATLYATTKGAIHTYTRGLAKELGPDIRVNAIAPGIIETDFHVRHSSDELLQSVAEKTPVKRNGSTEEMAAGVLYLCGPGAGFVTGEVLDMNGGLWFA